MDMYSGSLVVFGLMFLFLGVGVWMFVGFLLLSAVGLMVVVDMNVTRVGAIMSQVMWRSASAWELSAIPLFILMGDIIFHTDMAQRLFRGLSPWVNRIPGRLMHTNVVGCTLFSAICGSSVATTATIAKITVKELRQRGYDQNLALGSLAGAGTFGLMIPPSINMIIYGVIAEVSISRMFAAGIIPGILLALFYSGYIVIRCVINPRLAPQEDAPRRGQYLAALRDLAPITLLIILILGSIYTGVATPSESAAMGLICTLVMVLVQRQLTLRVFITALMNTVKTSAMLLSLMAAASFMSAAMGYMHVPQEMSEAIAQLNLPPLGLILLLGVVYVILGCPLDGISMMVMSVPIVLPLVVSAGYDPIWFGIFLVVMAELGQLTPPVGFNLFVLQSATGYSMSRLARASFPFFVITCLVGLLLAVFPDLVTWLP
ncbi:MAG TPA: TRAP transporter large permease subunit, partial [Paenirhodobacter sp.]